MSDNPAEATPTSATPQLHPLAQPMEEIVDAFIASPEFVARLTEFQSKVGTIADPAEKALAESHFKMAVTKASCASCCASHGLIPGTAPFQACVHDCMNGTGICAGG